MTAWIKVIPRVRRHSIEMSVAADGLRCSEDSGWQMSRGGSNWRDLYVTVGGELT